MNSFRQQSWPRRSRGGFSLVEATFTIGLFSFGFLALAPLLALGLTSARLARDNRATAQIAQTLIEEAKQGTLVAGTGTVYLDIQGGACASTRAAYMAQATFSPIPAGSVGASGTTSLCRLSLRVTPLGAPGQARIYAVLISTP